MAKIAKNLQPSTAMLGDFVWHRSSFPFPEQLAEVNQQLAKCILEAPKESFLLPAVIEFIANVNRLNILPEPYTLSLFEFWLNQQSPQQNDEIRSKIVGKSIPREDYQRFFPIGMNQSHPGPHFVVAHLSPDIDTMTASFFGWIDAFAARVGTGRHFWCLPGGPPDTPVVSIFQEFLGKDVFTVVAQQEKTLAVSALDLIEKDQAALGTVSFRDFCNLEEVNMPANLVPISVVDHHKATLKMSAPPVVTISDVQSCNVLMAELMFVINDPYSLGGMSEAAINEAMQKAKQAPVTVSNIRILQKLVRRQLALNTRKAFYIHPEREVGEYIFFLHAILDDTDLLTKVSNRDVNCVVELINRIKSLMVGDEVEVIHLDDIPKDKNYAKAAAKKILQHPEMYSFYQKVYAVKEQEIEKQLQFADDALFVDTKEQNGCCRVGQTKVFSVNLNTLRKHSEAILSKWLQKAEKRCQGSPEIDLHMHMMSTIASADDVFKGTVGQYSHLDELWLWVPATKRGHDHLSSFLAAFEGAHKLGSKASIEFLKGCQDEVKKIVANSCPNIPQKSLSQGLEASVVVLRYPAGLLNSRKTMITPFLPKKE